MLNNEEDDRANEKEAGDKDGEREDKGLSLSH